MIDEEARDLIRHFRATLSLDLAVRIVQRGERLGLEPGLILDAKAARLGHALHKALDAANGAYCGHGICGRDRWIHSLTLLEIANHPQINVASPRLSAYLLGKRHSKLPHCCQTSVEFHVSTIRSEDMTDAFGAVAAWCGAAIRTRSGGQPMYQAWKHREADVIFDWTSASRLFLNLQSKRLWQNILSPERKRGFCELRKVSPTVVPPVPGPDRGIVRVRQPE